MTATFLALVPAQQASASDGQGWDALPASPSPRMMWQATEPASSVATTGTTFTELALPNQPVGRSTSANAEPVQLTTSSAASQFPLLWLATFWGMATAVVVLRRHTQARWKQLDQRHTLAPWKPAYASDSSNAQGWRLSRFEELDEDDSFAPLYSSLDDPEDRHATRPSQLHQLPHAAPPTQAPHKHAPHLIDLEIFDIEARLIRPHPPAGG